MRVLMVLVGRRNEGPQVERLYRLEMRPQAEEYVRQRRAEAPAGVEFAISETQVY